LNPELNDFKLSAPDTELPQRSEKLKAAASGYWVVHSALGSIPGLCHFVLSLCQIRIATFNKGGPPIEYQLYGQTINPPGNNPSEAVNAKQDDLSPPFLLFHFTSTLLKHPAKNDSTD